MLDQALPSHWANYSEGKQQVGQVADPADWRISPLRASDLAGVAPAVVVTAGYDPLRDQGNAYAAALQAAGVPVEEFVDKPRGYVPTNPLGTVQDDFSRQYGIPLEAAMGSRETAYPEFQQKLKTLAPPPAKPAARKEAR